MIHVPYLCQAGVPLTPELMDEFFKQGKGILATIAEAVYNPNSYIFIYNENEYDFILLSPSRWFSPGLQLRASH